MPLIWGSTAPAFIDGTEAANIHGLIMYRYNQIISELSEDDDGYAPILMTDQTGDLLGEIWAEGFLTAMRLRGRSLASNIRQQPRDSCKPHHGARHSGNAS